MAPDLSIIIASVNGWFYLSHCLLALKQQQGSVIAEIIVVDRVGAEVTSALAVAYPDVRCLSFSNRNPPPKTVADLRSAGIALAKGKIIAITEDHCIPPPNWYESIDQAHINNDSPAIGGTVDNGATQSLTDWTAFFCEYSNFMSPMLSGAVGDLPAPNVSYKASQLKKILHQLPMGYQETIVHNHFLSQGQRLWSDASISMIHRKHFTKSDFLKERYHYSRAFAGQRSQSFSVGKRLLYLLATTALLPPLILTRITLRVFKRRQHIGIFLISLPYLLVCALVWAFGECMGYASGPGSSELHLS